MSKRKQTWDNYKEKVANKRRNDKGAAAAAGGSDGITVLRGCLARWKANARSTRESGHWLWFLSIKSHHSRTLKKHASCILTRIWFWTTNRHRIEHFIEQANNHHPTIKFTAEYFRKGDRHFRFHGRTMCLKIVFSIKLERIFLEN